MALNNGRYYTHSLRIAGKVVRFYFGCSENARQIAAENDRIRAENQRKRLKNRKTREEWAEIDQNMDIFHRLAEALAHAARIEAGYHHHRGQWRKRRVFNSKRTESPKD